MHVYRKKVYMYVQYETLKEKYQTFITPYTTKTNVMYLLICLINQFDIIE